MTTLRLIWGLNLRELDLLSADKTTGEQHGLRFKCSSLEDRKDDFGPPNGTNPYLPTCLVCPYSGLERSGLECLWQGPTPTFDLSLCERLYQFLPVSKLHKSPDLRQTNMVFLSHTMGSFIVNFISSFSGSSICWRRSIFCCFPVLRMSQVWEASEQEEGRENHALKLVRVFLFARLALLILLFSIISYLLQLTHSLQCLCLHLITEPSAKQSIPWRLDAGGSECCRMPVAQKSRRHKL